MKMAFRYTFTLLWCGYAAVAAARNQSVVLLDRFSLNEVVEHRFVTYEIDMSRKAFVLKNISTLSEGWETYGITERVDGKILRAIPIQQSKGYRLSSCYDPQTREFNRMLINTVKSTKVNMITSNTLKLISDKATRESYIKHRNMHESSLLSFAQLDANANLYFEIGDKSVVCDLNSSRLKVLKVLKVGDDPSLLYIDHGGELARFHRDEGLVGKINGHPIKFSMIRSVTPIDNHRFAVMTAITEFKPSHFSLALYDSTQKAIVFATPPEHETTRILRVGND
jgi:hypothetical protein